MKCIKAIVETPNTKLGTILRVKDEEANEKVTKGNWQYIPKSEWKVISQKPKQSASTNEETTKSTKKRK